MAPEETDFERNPAQKQFRVTRNSYNSKRGAQGLLGEGGPLTSWSLAVTSTCRASAPSGMP